MAKCELRIGAKKGQETYVHEKRMGYFNCLL